MTEADRAKANAEAVFKRQQLLDATGYHKRATEAAKIAEAEKTAKLRGLRLAKEKVDQIAADVRKAKRETMRKAEAPS